MRCQFEGYILHDTNRAVLFQSHYWEEPDFMPKSQIEIIRDPDTDEVVLIASSWISKQKGLKEVNYYG